MITLSLPLKVDLKHVHLTDEQFYQLCINNPNLNDRSLPSYLEKLVCRDLSYRLTHL